jgi:peptidyl-tRNA hydrolase
MAFLGRTPQLLSLRNGFTARFVPGLLIGALLHAWFQGSQKVSLCLNSIVVASCCKFVDLYLIRSKVLRHVRCMYSYIVWHCSDDSKSRVGHSICCEKWHGQQAGGDKKATPSEGTILQVNSTAKRTKVPVEAPSEELKMVLLVNQELKMSKGKIAAQCAHAAVGILQQHSAKRRTWFKQWEMTGQKKIALRVETTSDLLAFAEQGEAPFFTHGLLTAGDGDQMLLLLSFMHLLAHEFFFV